MATLWQQVFPDNMVDLIGTLKNTAGNYIVNLSAGSCIDAATCSKTDWDDNMSTKGAAIVKEIRRPGSGLENRVLLVFAAGQEGIDASREGGGQRAVLGPFPPSSGVVSPLMNGLVVGSFDRWPGNGIPGTGDPRNMVMCRTVGTNTGDSIAGFGIDVWAYIDAAGTVKQVSGTSFAAPQVAAAADFLWTIAGPTMTAPQVVDRLIAAGNLKAGCGRVLDAYAAALTADTDIQVGHAPVRLAILDVANDQDQDIPDGKFDEHDIKRFLKACADAATGASGNSGKYTANYSRFDLNGDGYTGGSAPTYTGRFKLEEPFPLSYTRPNPLSYGTVTQNIEGVPVNFNESNLTDLEILAYYAYSPLFDSTPESKFERAMLFLPYADKLHIALDRIGITWKPPFQAPSGWTAAPAIEVFSLGAPSPTYNGSNFLLERGNPLFSYQVPPTSTFYAANDTTGVPYLLYPNRLPASSFFAYDALGRVWINATARHWQMTGTSILEREYQSRFALGAPTATGRSKTVTIGSVPGDNNFNVAKMMTGEYFDLVLKFVAAP